MIVTVSIGPDDSDTAVTVSVEGDDATWTLDVVADMLTRASTAALGAHHELHPAPAQP